MSKETLSKLIADCDLRAIPETEIASVASIGLPGHGKSTFKAALFKQLSHLSQFLPGFAMIPSGASSLERCGEMAERLKKGQLPTPTEPGDELHLAVMLNNLPSHLPGRTIRRMLGFFDFAGEYFQPHREVPEGVSLAISSCQLPWLFFNSNHPTNGRPEDLAAVFEKIVQSLSRHDRPRGNRRRPILIVFSCIDTVLDQLPRPVQKYLSENELSELSFEFDVLEYMQRAEEISNALSQFFSRHPAVANMVNSAEAQGFDLKFCVCSATGSIAAGAQVAPETLYPMRVLAPLFWSLYFQCDFAPKRHGNVVVMVPSDQDKPETVILGEQLCSYLSSFGIRYAYYIGNVRTQMGEGVAANLPPLTRSYPHLLFPLLDPVCHWNGFSDKETPDVIVVLVDRLPFDYEDLKRHPLAARILWCSTEVDLLNQLESNRLIVRRPEDFPSVQHQVVNMLNRC